MLRRRLLPEGRPGTWRSVWAGENPDRLAEALAGLRSPPLFGGPQVLVVRRADDLPEAEQEQLLGALDGLGSAGALILVAKKAELRGKLLAACQRAGAAYKFPALDDPRAVQPWVTRLARERGHPVAPAAVEELAERCGTSLGVLASELEKLSLHVGPGARIEVAHVREMVGAGRSHDARELTERLARRDLPGAARLLRRILAGGEPPIRLLAFVAGNLRRALQVVELAEQGLRPDAIATRLKMSPGSVGFLARRGRAADLERSLLVLRRLDLELKSARDEEASFEAALLEIARLGDSRPQTMSRGERDASV